MFAYTKSKGGKCGHIQHEFVKLNNKKKKTKNRFMHLI